MSRNSKYNWDLYFPRMVELYFQQLSIPKIRETIVKENDGSAPQLSIFYKKFKDEKYPTDPVERKKFLTSLNKSTWLVEGGPYIASGSAHPRHTSSKLRDGAKDTDISSISMHNSDLNGSQSIDSFELSRENAAVNWSAGICEGTLHNGLVPISQAGVAQEAEYFRSPQIHADGAFENLMRSDALGDNAEFISQTADNLGAPYSHGDLGTNSYAGLFDTDMESIPSFGWGPISHSAPSSDHGNLETGQRESGTLHSRTTSVDTFQAVSSDCASQISFHQFKEPPMQNSYEMPSTGSFGRSVPWAKAKPRYNRSCTPEKRNSTSTSDSGYDSGQNSPLPPLAEYGQVHPRSLSEFKNLYRVPCPVLHEPQPFSKIYVPQSQARFTDVAMCNTCHYSAIHNLSWSCRHLKFEVFLAELKLQVVIYDVKALDATGNSALHYAAAGGAGFGHFNALIDLGINPYQMNTAGQLFIHCLSPYIKQPGFVSADESLVTVFIADLINLMNKFQPNGVFDWPDNQGRTALDALALRLGGNGNELQQKVLHFVANAGYTTEVSNQFTKFQKRRLGDSLLLKPDLGPAIFSHLLDHTLGNDFAKNQEKQSKAWEIIQSATKDPTYIDPDTGDNVLHALARCRSTPPDLLFRIKDSIQKGASLNLHNYQEDYPLASFIQHRPFNGVENDETGPTLSKYLDVLLWKDVLQRVPNRINVNTKNREGATALHYAAVQGRPDSVRSLIEAGANFNARTGNDGKGVSVLRAALKARTKAVMENDLVRVDRFDNVISYLEHEKAIPDPTIHEERALATNSVRFLPM